MIKEEWDALRRLADDRSIAIKKANKGSCVVVWFGDDYIKEAEDQQKDNTVYNDLNFKETMLSDLVDKSNKFFKILHSRKCITEKELKYFSYQFKKTTNRGNLYLLPKIHKGLSNIPGRTFISNCRAPTEKASEFLDCFLKSLMHNGWSYIRDSGDFIDKMKKIGKIPECFLVTADVVGLYPSIPHNECIQALKQKLEEQPSTKIPTNDLVKLAEFVQENNLFKFNGKVKLSSRFLELQLELSSLLHTSVSIWIKQRLIFLRLKISNHLFDCIVLVMSFYMDT